MGVRADDMLSASGGLAIDQYHDKQVENVLSSVCYPVISRSGDMEDYPMRKKLKDVIESIVLVFFLILVCFALLFDRSKTAEDGHEIEGW